VSFDASTQKSGLVVIIMTMLKKFFPSLFYKKGDFVGMWTGYPGPVLYTFLVLGVDKKVQCYDPTSSKPEFSWFGNEIHHLSDSELDCTIRFTDPMTKKSRSASFRELLEEAKERLITKREANTSANPSEE
jgi:hypothetical protein